MRKLCLVLLMLSAVVLLQGCAQKYNVAPESKCLSGIDLDTAMKASELALVRMNFVIDKADANLAIMTTRPMSGAQFFELWRKDNVGGYNTALASLHSIQRTVELGFAGKQGEICIVCKVKVERLSIPEKDIDSAGRVYSMFSRSRDTRQNLAINETQREKMEWIDIGRDYGLESVILKRIDKQIATSLVKGNKKQ
jgi:hypothetical protein